MRTKGAGIDKERQRNGKSEYPSGRTVCSSDSTCSPRHNTDDKDIIKFLKQFTFLSKEEIEIYAKQVLEHPETREAQKTLAKFIVELIHGKKDFLNCEKISNALFYGDFKKLNNWRMKN